MNGGNFWKQHFHVPLASTNWLLQWVPTLSAVNVKLKCWWERWAKDSSALRQTSKSFLICPEKWNTPSLTPFKYCAAAPQLLVIWGLMKLIYRDGHFGATTLRWRKINEKRQAVDHWILPLPIKQCSEFPQMTIKDASSKWYHKVFIAWSWKVVTVLEFY